MRQEDWDFIDTERVCVIGAWLCLMALLLSASGCTPQFALMNYPGEPTTAKSPPSPKSQCQACANIARNAENRSYKLAKEQMKAVHEREQKRIKAQYDACPAGEAVQLSGPNSGDTIVTTPVVPDAGELLPDSGTIKDVKPPKCKD